MPLTKQKKATLGSTLDFQMLHLEKDLLLPNFWKPLLIKEGKAFYLHPSHLGQQHTNPLRT